MIGQARRVAELTRLHNSDGISDIPVISFISGKGGTGRSFLALNTAYILASAGYPVLLVDANHQNPNLHIMNNIFVEKTLQDYCAGRELFGDVVQLVQPNLYCMFGSAENAEELRQSHLMSLFGAAKRFNPKFAAILLDCPPGVQDAILLHSSLQIIVSTPEPTAVMDAYVLIKYISLLQGNTAARSVIINRCRTPEEGNAAYANLDRATGHFLHEKINCLGLVPQHSEVYDSIMEQQILLGSKPNAAVAPYLKKIVQGIGIIKG